MLVGEALRLQVLDRALGAADLAGDLERGIERKLDRELARVLYGDGPGDWDDWDDRDIPF